MLRRLVRLDRSRPCSHNVPKRKALQIIEQLIFAVWKWQVRRDVRKRGWRGIYVGDYHGSPPSWAYSVGFWESAGAPEIVVFDLPQEDANNLLWNAYEQLRTGQLTIRDGEAWLADKGVAPVWRRVHPSQVDADEGWFTFARWYRFRQTGGDDLEVFQLVLPDGEGILPWQSGYDERLRPLQPALYLPAGVAEPPPV
jgi:hypothetical protein